jgi:hypothetical protein
MRNNSRTKAKNAPRVAAEKIIQLEESQTTEETPTAPSEEQSPGENAPETKTGAALKTIPDIITKHRKINHCLEKRASIDKASKELDSFNLSSSSMNDTLIIKDSKGNKFETSKTDLIKEVIEFLQKVVEKKTTEVEEELLQLEAA